MGLGKGDSAIIGAGQLYGTDRPDATALVITDGSIASIGPDVLATERVDPAKVLDVRALGADRTLIAPAFVDAHLHTVQAGQVILGLDLHGVASREQLLDRLAAQAAARPGARILVGQGWDDRGWPDPRPPTRTELDRAAGGAVVYLARVDVHSAVVSTALLDELPEVRAAPGYRDDGLVSQHAHHLCRGAARPLLHRRRAPGRCADGPSSLRRARRRHGARSRRPPPGTGARTSPAYGRPQPSSACASSATGVRLPIRRRSRWPSGTDSADWPGDLCIDGAIGSRTAALTEDYADQPGRGVRYLDDDEIRDHLVACTRAGLQGGFHCIGDDAVRAAAQGLRRAAEITGGAALRAAGHRLEHVEMVAAAELSPPWPSSG